MELTPSQLSSLLDELVSRLRERDVKGHIRIVGGAAMALRFPDDPAVRATADIDAVYEPRPDVDAIIAALADEQGLEIDWVNARAASWLRVDPPVSSDRFEVVVATPRQLVAMKLAAAREQDLHDLRILARHLRIENPQDLVDIAFEIYGEDSVELPDSRESYLWLASDVLGVRG